MKRKKNITRYYQVWKLRKEGKKLKDIAEIMGFGIERARYMNRHFNFLIENKITKIPQNIRSCLQKTSSK